MEQCVQASAGFNIVPQLDARFEAKSCLEVSCVFCGTGKSCQSISASAISAAWKFCGALSYNKNCDGQFGDVGITNGGLTITVGKVEANVDPGNGQIVRGESFDGFTFGPFFQSEDASQCR